MHHITFAKLVSLCVRVCVFREEAVTGGGNQCPFYGELLDILFSPLLATDYPDSTQSVC